MRINMKNFRNYLTESERSYDYRIKIVGDVDDAFIKSLEGKLAQFDVVKFGSSKRTPVQLKPADFPAHANERVTSIDVTFRYPAIEPQIKQLAQLDGLDPNRIIMKTVEHEDSMDSEREKMKDQGKDLLKNTDLPAPDAEQKALKADHAAAPADHAVLKNAYKSNFTIAGGKTPAAKTTNDLPMGNKSPLTKVKRPPRPATGAQPKG